MRTRLRIRVPSMDEWIHAFLLTGAVVMTMIIVTGPDVLLLSV